MIFISIVWHVPPEPQSGRVTELPKSEEKKLEVGGEVSDHLGQTNYVHMCIIVTIYISNLKKKQITCHLFNYIFQKLVFPLLDNSANKHAEQPRFFSCFTSGSCTLAKYTKLCMVWQPNICNMLCPYLQMLATPLMTLQRRRFPAGRPDLGSGPMGVRT